jgi:ankyrin repeat protein
MSSSIFPSTLTWFETINDHLGITEKDNLMSAAMRQFLEAIKTNDPDALEAAKQEFFKLAVSLPLLTSECIKLGCPLEILPRFFPTTEDLIDLVLYLSEDASEMIIERLKDANLITDVMLRLAEKNEMEVLKKLINQKKAGIHALIEAAKEGDLKTVQALISAGDDVNQQNDEGDTALIIAIEKGHKEIVTALLEQPEIDLNHENNFAHTPLILAIEEGDNEIVTALLAKSGIDVNYKNKDQYTPLIAAANKGSNEIVEALLLKGADPVYAIITAHNDKDGGVVLKTLKSLDLREVLLRGIFRSLEAKNPSDEEAEVLYAEISRTEIALQAIKDKSDPALLLKIIGTDTDADLEKILGAIVTALNTAEPLATAVSIGTETFTGVGVGAGTGTATGAGAGVGAETATGAGVGAESGSTEESPPTSLPDYLSTLLEKGHINQAIYNAATTRDIELLNRLLSYGTKTPLINAASNNDLSAVEALLETDCDVSQIDRGGNTALLIAAHKKFDKIVESLLKRPEINVNLKNSKGETALIFAAAKAHTEILNTLLEKPQIDVNLQNNKGETALIWAVSSVNKEVVEALLKRPEIDVNLQNNKGETALIWAVSYGNIDIVQALLRRPDINVNHRDKDGHTALDLAINKGKREIVPLLLERGADPVYAIITAHKNDWKSALETLKSPDLREVLLRGIVRSLGEQDHLDEDLKALYAEIPRTEIVLQAIKDKVSSELFIQIIGTSTDWDGPDWRRILEAITTALSAAKAETTGVDVGAGAVAGAGGAGAAADGAVAGAGGAGAAAGGAGAAAGGAGVVASDSSESPIRLLLSYLRAFDAEFNLTKIAYNIVKTGNIELLKKLLTAGSSVLVQAAEKGNLETVQALLELEGEVNSTDRTLTSPLMMAAQHGHKDIVDLLLAKNDVKVNLQSKLGDTALILAADFGHKEIVESLLKKTGIDVNLETNTGATALTAAANKGRKEIVEALLACGADPVYAIITAYNNLWKPVLKTLQSPDLRPVLLRGIVRSLKAKPLSGGQVEFFSAKSFGIGIVLQAIKDKVSSELFIQIIGTDIHHTPTLLKEILEAIVTARSAAGPATTGAGMGAGTATGAGVEAGSGSSESSPSELPDYLSALLVNAHITSAMAEVAKTGSIPLLQKILSYGTYKPLIAATLNNDLSSVQAMLKTDCDVHETDRQGNSALLVATTEKVDKIVKILLERPEINVNLQNNNGETALILAAAKRDRDARNTSIVEILVERPEINVNLQNNNGETALSLAAANKQTEILNTLLKKTGINVNLQNKKGQTALIWAASSGNRDIVQALLRRPEINVNHRDRYGYTALDFAIHKGNREILPLLLDRGADPVYSIIRAKENNWTTVLETLKSSDLREVVLRGIIRSLKENDPTEKNAALLYAEISRTEIALQAIKDKADPELLLKIIGTDTDADLNIILEAITTALSQAKAETTGVDVGAGAFAGAAGAGASAGGAGAGGAGASAGGAGAGVVASDSSESPPTSLLDYLSALLKKDHIPIQNHFAAFCLPFLLPQNSSSLRHRNLAMPRFRKILRKQNCLTKFQQNEFAWVYH